jgi:glycosyltransferase involved in cell wall biosynthesis
MKILVISQYYYPETFRITDVCESLSKKGHDVTVLTGQPNYPEGKIYKGYQNKYTNEIYNSVKVIRTKIKPRLRGSLNLMLNYFSFPFYARKIINKLDDDFDCVFINQLSPILSAIPGIIYAKKHKIKSVLYCLDLWPESLVSGGIKKHSLIYMIFGLISKQIYKKVDLVLISSKSFEDKFSKYGINVEYLPQFSEDIFLNSTGLDNIRSDKFFNLVFTGNIGRMQSIETILLAANELKSFNDIRFNIYGIGSKYDQLLKMKTKLGLHNVFFHGKLSIEQLPPILSSSSALLISLKIDDFISKTLPGKIQTYMASGKPIIGSIDGEAKKLIEMANVGYVTKAEDYIGLAKIILMAKNNPNFYLFGLNGRDYYNENFTKDIFIDKLVRFLKRQIKVK